MAPTREKSLGEREFELLLEGTRHIDNPERGHEACAVILVGGRLGLRPGEIAHLRSSWVDWQRRIIRIPEHHTCEKGRDGGICGYCRQAVEQRIRHGTEKSFDELAGQYWLPKTPAAVRAVPFHFSPRVGVALELLLDEHGGWPYSFSTLQRRVNNAIEHAPKLSTDSTSPHGLRATAASYHAAQGLDIAALQSMFGWEDIATARQYLNINGEMTKRALSTAH